MTNTFSLIRYIHASGPNYNNVVIYYTVLTVLCEYCSELQERFCHGNLMVLLVVPNLSFFTTQGSQNHTEALVTVK